MTSTGYPQRTVSRQDIQNAIQRLRQNMATGWAAQELEDFLADNRGQRFLNTEVPINIFSSLEPRRLFAGSAYGQPGPRGQTNRIVVPREKSKELAKRIRGLELRPGQSHGEFEYLRRQEQLQQMAYEQPRTSYGGYRTTIEDFVTKQEWLERLQKLEEKQDPRAPRLRQFLEERPNLEDTLRDSHIVRLFFNDPSPSEYGLDLTEEQRERRRKAGRKGGKATLKKYGTEYFKRLAKTRPQRPQSRQTKSDSRTSSEEYQQPIKSSYGRETRHSCPRSYVWCEYQQECLPSTSDCTYIGDY